MQEDYLDRTNSETELEYHKRLVYGKLINKDLSDEDYAELSKYVYGKEYSSDVCRRMMYGSRYTLELADNKYKGRTRILVISDMHYPFNLPIEVLKSYKGMVDILEINGDEEDCQAISKFQKRYRVNFVEEMIGCRQMLIDIIQYIEPKKVIFNYGNHNTRFISYFSDKLSEDLLQLMPETNLDFIVDMGFWKHNHEDKSKTFYEPLTKVFEGTGIEIIYTKEWFNRIGNTIFCHPKAFKSGILATTEKSYLYFLQKGEKPYDCIVMAHTHNTALSKYGKTYLIEQGCLCEEPDYAQDGKMMRPQSPGFAYIIQDKEGRFIYSDSKLVIL